MNFFCKYVLWVGAESDLLKARLFIWAFAAIACSKEYWVYIDDPNCKRVGPFVWLGTLTIGVELSIWFKFSRGMFEEEFPLFVYMMWVVYFGLAIIGGIYAYNNGVKAQELERQHYEKTLMSKSKKKRYNLLNPDITIESTQ